jgi:hypothetical protein
MGQEDLPHPAIPFEIGDITPMNAAIKLDVSFHQQILFHNGFGRNVHVVYRNGVLVTVPPASKRSSPRGALIIRQIPRGSLGVIVNQQILSSDSVDEEPKERKLIREEIAASSTSYGTAFGSGAAGGLDYALKQSDFTRNTGSLYLPQFDVVVSLEDNVDKVPYHPYSNEGMRAMILANDDGIMGRERFQYGISIVDHHKRFGRKYINIAGEVFPINPVTKTELADGVYLKTSSTVSEAGHVSTERVLFLTYEQAKEKLRLWNTVEEAITLGNPKVLDDREQRDLVAEQRRLEHESRMRQREREEELELIKHNEAVRVAQQAALEAQLKDQRLLAEHRRAMESMVRKDYYEDRSYARKDSTDFLKYVPALITAIGSLAILLAKRQ